MKTACFGGSILFGHMRSTSKIDSPKYCWTRVFPCFWELTHVWKHHQHQCLEQGFPEIRESPTGLGGEPRAACRFAASRVASEDILDTCGRRTAYSLGVETGKRRVRRRRARTTSLYRWGWRTLSLKRHSHTHLDLSKSEHWRNLEEPFAAKNPFFSHRSLLTSKNPLKSIGSSKASTRRTKHGGLLPNNALCKQPNK